MNRGEDGGVIALLRNDYPWIDFMWCVAQRLELVLKDALEKTSFSQIDEMIP